MTGTALPTFTIWSRHNSLDELSMDGVPEWVLRSGSRWFGSPVLPYWIMDTILANLRSATHSGNLPNASIPLLGVDVVLNSTYPSMSVLELSIWLTKQVNAYMRRYGHQGWRSKADWCVRCSINTDSYPNKSDIARPVAPVGWNSWGGRLSRKIFTAEDAPPPFQVYFPTGKFKKEFVYRLSPESKYPLDSSLTLELKPAHKHTIPDTHNTIPPLDQFPLVGRAEAIVVQFPLDGDLRMYLRHLGPHETWVRNPETDWKIVPRDAWMPVEDGGKILLGRRVVTTAQNEFPGSLILICKKIRYGSE